jgi:hypothetical protein
MTTSTVPSARQRPSFWSQPVTITWLIINGFFLALTILAVVLRAEIDIVIFESILTVGTFGYTAVRYFRHLNAPMPKGEFLDMIRERIGQEDTLCYPFFRNCPLTDLRGGQGGWTTPDAFKLKKSDLSLVDKPAFLHLTQSPDPSADCVVLVAMSDDGRLTAMTFGSEPQFARLVRTNANSPMIFYSGHVGPARFDPALFNFGPNFLNK